MKTRYTAALSVLAGLAVGAAAVEALHAQAKPPAYVVAEIEVTNLTPYDKEYVPAANEGDCRGRRQIHRSRRRECGPLRRATQRAHCHHGLREHGYRQRPPSTSRGL